MRPLSILLALILPRLPAPIVDHVDTIERNTVACQWTGANRLEQIIYWRWDTRTNGRRVVAWRLVRGVSRVVHRDGSIVETWHDGDQRREIHSRRYVETLTFDDPELADREILPVDYREGLRPIPPNSTKFPSP